ncbi:glycosyltransferase family 2 protein [Butyrivibrio sp. X503]|nr:glycosyltransferase family 2 protein [Butyrivibrio sp. X503]
MLTDNNEKLVSIIIPVYQAKDTLRECVLSCLNQKEVNASEFEVILIDDGSTDGSDKICDELASEYEGKVFAYHIKNGGVSNARNLGIEKATGRYIAFVDADDKVLDEYLENMLRVLDDSTVLVDEIGSDIGTGKISGYQYLENYLITGNSHVWGKLFLRKAISEENIRFKDGLTIGEDLLFLMDIALSQAKEHTIKCIDKADYIYTDNENGAMKTAFKESFLDQLTCWKLAEERLISAGKYVSRYAHVSLGVSMVLTALLVVGKVAMLDEKERDNDLSRLAIDESKKQILHALKTRGVFAGLPMGHKLKVMIFRISPNLYLKMYGNFKRS